MAENISYNTAVHLDTQYGLFATYVHFHSLEMTIIIYSHISTSVGVVWQLRGLQGLLQAHSSQGAAVCLSR